MRKKIESILHRRIRVGKHHITVLSLILSLSVFSIIGYAVWGSFFQGISGLAITSEGDGGIIYTSYLDSQGVDVTDAGIVVNDYVELLNENGDVNVTVEYAVLKTDNTTDGCTDYLNDVDVVIDPINFGMTNSETKIVNVTYTVARWSCPGDIQVDLNITTEPV